MNGLIVTVSKRKLPGRFFTVSDINPKLRVITIASEIKPRDSAIAGIACGNKLGAMICRHDTRAGVSSRGMWNFFALQRRSYHNSSTNSSTNAFQGNVEICKFLIINDAGVAELVDAPDLGSGGEIRRGSSPLPGSFARIKTCDKNKASLNGLAMQ